MAGQIVGSIKDGVAQLLFDNEARRNAISIDMSRQAADLLEQYQTSGQHISSTLRSHADLGESVQWISLLFLVLAAAWVFGHKRQLSTKVVRTVLAVLVALSAIAATVMVIEAGHNGAKAKWEQTK